VTVLNQDAARRLVERLTHPGATADVLGLTAEQAARSFEAFGQAALTAEQAARGLEAFINAALTFKQVSERQTTAFGKFDRCAACGGSILGQRLVISQGKNAGAYHPFCYRRTAP
jgi:hypothetical protein